MSIVGPNGKIGKIVGPNGPVGKVVGPSGAVWTAGAPVVEITGTSGTVSRDQFRSALSEYGLNHATVTELPFLLDTSKATNLDQLFADCRKLVTVPPMDTSNVTTMMRTFDYCNALVSVPDLDARKVGNFALMLYDCRNLTDGNIRLRMPSVELRYGVNVSNMINLSGLTEKPFYTYDSSGNFLPIVEITGTSNFTSRDQFRAALSRYGLDRTTVTKLPFLLDTSQATGMRGMFQDCASLTYLSDMDASNVTDVRNMFQDCASLTDGNVRLIRRDGTKPTSNTYMIRRSGLTREPFFWPDGTPIN